MTALATLARSLEVHGEVRRDEPLWRHTTFGVGGPADVHLIVHDAEGLAAAVRAARDADVPSFVLGSGSNIVVADAGIRGLVIDNRARTEIEEGAHRFLVESGVSFAAFARKMCRRGIAGLAWAAGIPGTIGGAVVYNAGAYGGCLGDVLTRVRLTTPEGTDRWHEAAEMNLVYRGSVLRERPGEVVLEAELALHPGVPGELMEQVAEFDRRRLAAQPRGRNAGSMFKNPPEHPAWKLIDEVGMRGQRRGDAGISEQHSNFFVNHGSARAADIDWLATEAERRVREQFGIELQREVGFVGAW
ncbi:MAG: UDP-N-acetylmuramate dehydrogenase [Dehalococcoidia bacterium]|nr:UDP-N-acetylmuramate dehydrogenase [Dehalococcoidia bacterium]MCA9844987.1 UDP-N-acetylmuramate dehydrogenase [Dehalococcoidia bacterium]